MMRDELRDALADYLTAMADDELILGHRDSEWCGRAPILEEDIAFANIALDEIGHALIWYGLLADLVGQDPDFYPDRMAYHRPAERFRCARFVAMPNGDWAFTVLRQYLFDAAERVRLGRLAESRYEPLAGAAEKIRREEVYHLRHGEAWIRRLGLGTEESAGRMQAALELLWPQALGLFEPLPSEGLLVAEGMAPDSKSVLPAWLEVVQRDLAEAGLEVPVVEGMVDRRRGVDDRHLEILLAELQSLARLYPDASW